MAINRFPALPTHNLVAFNTATSSENKIHDDEVAGALGFGGGLVPGVDVYAYLCQPAVAHWGIDVLTRGRISTRFGTPTYDGERIEVQADVDDEGVLRAGVHPAGGSGSGSATSGEQSPAAILDARLVDEPAQAPDIATASRPAPEDRPPASPASLAAGTVLGTFQFSMGGDEHAAYLADIRDEDSPVTDLGLLHPGALLRQANYALSETVLLGPWIHVGSTIHNHAPIAIGEEIEVRAVVTSNSERKGHRFVDADVVLLGSDGSTRAWIEHTAIYEPRQLRTES